MTRLTQTGSHIVALAVGLLVVSGIGFAGYRVLQANSPAASSRPPAASSQASSQPPAIKTKADLVQTGKALDSSAAQLNGSLNDASLNGDLDSLL